MNVEEFVELLDRAKRSGSGWEARCPAHEDRSPSLSVREGEDGKVLVFCHAGCDILDIVTALGIEQTDLFPDTEPEDERIIDRVYPYTDEVGNPLYEVVRYRPKGFAQKQGDKWSLKGARLVPYHLPALVKAADAQLTAAWVCEGEKDVEAMEDLGFTATCNAAGSSAWKDEFADYFIRFRMVLIAGHCDKPGRDFALKVAKSMHDRNIRCKIVDIATERNDGYDLYDFITEHGKESHRKLIETAMKEKVWTPDQEKPKKTIPIKSARDFIAGVPSYRDERDYLGPFLHGGYRIHVAGPIGHGKTTFLMEAVSAAVNGKEFLGWQGKGGLRALYIDLEMPDELLGQGIRDARLDDSAGFNLLHLPDGLRIDTNPEDKELLEAAIEGYDIVVIDPWYKLIEQELEYSSARNIVACLDGIRSRHPDMCMLVGLHAQEPEFRKAKLSLGNTSGFKFFQRPADIILMFQRLEGNTNRVTWVKNRSPRLDVDYGEEWELEWERGWGFTRTDDLEWNHG